MRVWRRFVRFFITRHWKRRSIPSSSSGCWRYRISDSPGVWSITSLDRKSKPSWARLTRKRGSADAITGLRQQDVFFGVSAHVRCEGKGRKERRTPLAKPAVTVLNAWIEEQGREPSKFLFPNARGERLSSDAVQHMVAKHVAVARQKCPSLVKKRVTPHVLRHTAAMELLQAGVDRSMIALWLGHESVETTQIYLNADLALKEEILAKINPVNGKPGRYRPTDCVLSFLSSL